MRWWKVHQLVVGHSDSLLKLARQAHLVDLGRYLGSEFHLEYSMVEVDSKILK